MTYIANHNNANLTRETTQWVCGDYAITRIAAWAVPAGIHGELDLPTHCDVYKTSTGDWCVTLDEAIAACQVADTIADDDITDDSDRSDILNSAICEELQLTVSQLNPEYDYTSADSPAYEIRKCDVRIGYVYEPADGFYSLPQLMFSHTTFHSPEAASISLMEFLRPAEVLLAETVARHIIADRQLLPEYI
jgi:hypothetical protein